MSLKSKLGRKAATSVVKHTVHGTVSKARRDPMRASRLLGLGAVLGLAAGFLGGRATKKALPAPTGYTPPQSPAFTPAPAATPPAPMVGADAETVTDETIEAPGLEAVTPIVPPDEAA